MRSGIRILIVVVVGALAVAFDKLLMPIPNPPDWLFAWGQWIVLGLAVIFGQEALRELRNALKSHS